MDGKNVVVLQTKANRLGMYLMGQAVFSAELVRMYTKAASVKSVAICMKDDVVMRALLKKYPDVEVLLLEEL